MCRSFPLTFALLLAAVALPRHAAAQKQLPCESLSQSSAVFVGLAGPPISQWMQPPNGPPIEAKFTPMTVEHAYRGVSTPIVYLMPLGDEVYPKPGQRYLVYGREYEPPHIVMASPGLNAIPIAAAGEDLAFLDTLAPGMKGGTISGLVRIKDLAYEGTTRRLIPLDRIRVQISSFTHGTTEKEPTTDGHGRPRLQLGTHSTEAVTTPDGRFSVFVPAGKYVLTPELPEGLVVADSSGRVGTTVSDGGCAMSTIDVLFNGRVRGVLRGPGGQPMWSASLVLRTVDSERSVKSVYTNRDGEFEFDGIPAGRYHLAANLYTASNSSGPPYPRIYYPGTTDRTNAVPVVVEHGRVTDGHDFSVPPEARKGQLDVIVQSDYAGELTLCFVHVDNDIPGGSGRLFVPRGVPTQFDVVDGLRYEVHAHLEFPGGHWDAEPLIVKGTADKTVVTLRPDAPRARDLFSRGCIFRPK